VFEPVLVPLRSRRALRAQFLQKIQHAVPSIVLLGDGLRRVQDGHGLLLGGIEILASVIVIGSVLRGLRQLRKTTRTTEHAHEHHGSVDWIDIFIGLMLFVEAYVHHDETGHWPRPTFLLGATMIVLGLAHHRLMEIAGKRRALRITPEGLSISGRRPFTRMTLKWADVASVSVDGDVARVVSTDGRTREVDLRDALNPVAVRDALLFASKHHSSLLAARSAQHPGAEPEN